jgi:DNA polymerase
MTKPEPNQASGTDFKSVPTRELARRLFAAVESRLRFEQHLGITGYPAPISQTEDPAAALARIRKELGDCQRCRLHQSRTQIVFGAGNPRALLMFVGEGPGEDEDRQGIPFVGKAGRLLTSIIENGMKLRREDCYIANVVKSRPSQNRPPEPDEVSACLPFLLAQIRAIRPRVIVALGAIAAHALLQTDTPISRLRGRFGSFEGIPVMPTFHPSYLLRNESAKRLVWEDVQKVMALLSATLENLTRD